MKRFAKGRLNGRVTCRINYFNLFKVMFVILARDIQSLSELGPLFVGVESPNMKGLFATFASLPHHPLEGILNHIEVRPAHRTDFSP
jgi:hypothetical protein